MGSSKKSKRSKYLSRVFGSTSESNVAQDAPGSPASGRSDSNLQPEQSSGEQASQQAAPLQPTMGHGSRLIDKLKSRFRSPSPSPRVGHHITTPVSQSTQVPDIIGPSPPSAMVWAKALEIAKKKLVDNNLPPLDPTYLTSQSAEENIGAVVKALNTLQQDDKKGKWSYTWRGKEVIIMEHLGKILKTAEKYSKVVDTAIQSFPQRSALVWSGVWAIMRVALNHVEAIEGFEVAITVLLDKLSICEFYADIYTGAALTAKLQSILDSALPELYAAVIVFAVKARTYFEAKGPKRLANMLQPFDVEFQPFIEEIDTKEVVIREFADAATMERIKDISTTATLALKVTQQSYNYIKDNKVLELLTVLTPLEPLKRHQDVRLPRTENSGTWLLELESFCQWRDSNTIKENDYVFCCYGIPGAGKTVICSVVIDNLYLQPHKYPNIGIACLYADYNDQTNQTLVNILGSFLRQLLTTVPESIPDEVINKLNDIHHGGRKVEMKDTLALLKIRLRQLQRTFICIDAVDELEPDVRWQLLQVLKELGTNDTTRLFLTGRGHIESEVQNCFHVTQRYTAVISASQQDIQEFVRRRINDDRNLKAMDGVLAQDIVDAIIEKSQGMFLLPTLHTKMVLGMPTKSKRRKALETLPSSPHDTFQGIITRIRGCPNPSQAELGMRVLMWLHFAYRPLKLIELQHVLAVEKGQIEFDEDNIPSLEVLLDCCHGLVVVDKETSTVRFVHYTLEECFRKYSREEFPNGYSSIAETYLTYLNFGELQQHCTNQSSLEEKEKKYAFLEYVARYWGTYVKQQSNDSLTELVVSIVDHESERPPCSIQVLYKHLCENKYWETLIARKFSGIHAIAYFGLYVNMLHFCTLDENILELKDDRGRSLLSWAAGGGDEDVVRLLIERNDINAKGNSGKTPLTWAAMNGHETVVRLLIERGDVDPDAKHNYPLRWAAYGGHEAVVRLLIERDDVDINSWDATGRTPLNLAAWSGQVGVVRLLIERDDVDINAKDFDPGETPLIKAAKYGHVGVVRLLLERDDVDVDAKDDEFGQTSFSWAAKRGNDAIVRLLIDRHDVDINAEDDYGMTPLSHAARIGYEAVVRLLAERDDVDINAVDRCGGKTAGAGLTPLIWAAMNGWEAVVRVLIERDVDINAKVKDGTTALSLAAKYGHEAVVRLLIERDDVDINTMDVNGWTPLLLAVEYGHEAIVALLNDRLDKRAKDSGGIAGVEIEAAVGATDISD